MRLAADMEWMLTTAYAATLLFVHLMATRGTFVLGQRLHDVVGASAATTWTRPWAQLTAPWFHSGPGHIGYNLLVLFATMPFAIRGLGEAALPLAIVASPIAAISLNALIIRPLAKAGWAYAVETMEPRLVGASIAIFAGAGIAWSQWDSPLAWLVLAGFVTYEVALAFAKRTQPFVCGYHLAGFVVGALFGWVSGQ